MSKRPSAPDDAQVQAGLARLWADGPRPGVEPRPGPQPRLSPRAVARAAVELADRHGLGALTMRGVADRLGVSVMSLYGYVPAKADLVDLMIDEALGEPSSPRLAGSLRARLEGIAAAN